TASLLKALDRYDAKATFFVTGNAGMHKSQIRRMARAGHAIGNHTFNHLRLTQYPTKRVRSQLVSVKRLVGSALAPCMRPPYGMINARVAKTAIGL
ncbi:MAG: polysaccharide deacetylase, partial [Acidimicrobiia bacterium]